MTTADRVDPSSRPRSAGRRRASGKALPVSSGWPALPLAEWRDTCETLHLWTQIVGKTSLALAPMENHWWQVSLRLTPRGLTTTALPWGQRSVEVEFDFIDHELALRSSDGASTRFDLVPRSVADFHALYLQALHSLGVEPVLMATPVEIEQAIPFARDRMHASYDADAVHRWWQILAGAERVLKRFRGRFLGKQSPVQFFWGSFDLASTRFSGRAAPRHPGGAPNCPDRVMVEAYSRECASAGFWPGGGAVDEPAFYAYAYPQPDGYEKHLIRPAAARFDAKAGEFILPYEAVRGAADGDAMLLEFFQSAYDAAADLGRWDRALLDRPQVQWP